MAPPRTQTPSKPPHTALHQILDRGQFSDTTRGRYRNVLNQWIQHAGTHPNGWTKPAMDSFRSRLISRGMSKKSIETYLASLRYVSKWWAEDHSGINFAMIQPIDLPEDDTKPRRALTQAEVTELLTSCASRGDLFALRDLVILIVDLETGIRVDGLAHMTFDKIGVSKHGYPIATVPIKSRRGRSTFPVPLSDLALHAIETLRNTLRVARGPVFRRLLKVDRGKGKLTVVKPTSNGITSTAIYDVVTKRAAQAHIGHVHPHILRHTFITWRIEAGVKPIEIAAITGHKVSSIVSDDAEDYGEIETYIDKEMLGAKARKHTPPWFAQLARRLLKEFS